MEIIADIKKYQEKEDLYINVRDAEGRVLPDELVSTLPYVSEDNPYHKEWYLRSRSYERVLKHLKKQFSRNSKLLDVGCGNGWMSHKLCEQGFHVTGLDLNIIELEQAERIFGTKSSLKWMYADVMENEIPGVPFDIIVLCASCQYFNNIIALTKKLSALLSDKGEIHIVDSVFYTAATVEAAKQRSHDYYKRMNLEEMSAYYFHHTKENLKEAGYKKRYPGLFDKSILQWWILKR